MGGEFNVSLVEWWGCDSIQDLIEASDKHTEMSHGKQDESGNTYFEVVSPLLCNVSVHQLSCWIGWSPWCRGIGNLFCQSW